VSEIKSRLNGDNDTLSYDLFDLDALQEMKTIITLLLDSVVKINIYDNDYEVNLEFLNNTIESYLETRSYEEEIDDDMFD
jgi:hypothetical protein